MSLFEKQNPNAFDFKGHLARAGAVVNDSLQRAARAKTSEIDADFDFQPESGKGCPVVTLKHPDGRTVTVNKPYMRSYQGVDVAHGWDDVKVYLKQGFVLPDELKKFMFDADRIRELEKQVANLNAQIHAAEKDARDKRKQ